MKMTVVSTKDGSLVGAMYGHITAPELTGSDHPDNGGSFRASLMAGPDQELHILDVPDDILQVSSPPELHKRLESEIRKGRSR
jgi:hypothetical protein